MPTNTQPKSNELIPAMIVYGVSSAIPTALFGMAIAGFMGKQFGVPINIWGGMFLGMCLGGSIGAFRAYVEFQRMNRLDRSAAFLGLHALEGPFQGEVMGRLGRLFDKQVKFLSAYSIDNESAKVVIGDVHLATQVVREGKKRTGSQASHSYVYFAFSDIRFPNFELFPETKLTRIMDNFHDEDIDFEDSIEFSSRYHLKSDDSEMCRKFFDATIRNAVSRTGTWTIRGELNFLVFLKRQRFNSADDQKQYLVQCMELADIFHARAIDR